MDSKLIILFFVVSLVFVNGCQSITGRAISDIEEKSAPILGKEIVPQATFSINKVIVKKGILESIEGELINEGKPFNPSYHISVIKEGKELFFDDFDFALINEGEKQIFSLPVGKKLELGVYDLVVELSADKKIISKQDKSFRVSFFNKVF